MKKGYLLGFIILCFFIFKYFTFSSNISSSDELHLMQFNNDYNIYSLVKPDSLNFCGEKVPISSQDIWERLDLELLRNTYWQSNTMLYFKRANKFFPIIEPILKKNNIPDDFKYLAVIESGLLNVISPAGATGVWQILKTTGKEYGLEINKYIDERYHLEKSTEAACKYLNEAYARFGNWTLVAASYNMGMNGIQRTIDKQETNNYYNLYLNQETSKYLFRIIAIKEIMQNPIKYGFVFRKKDLYDIPDLKLVYIDTTINDLYSFSQKIGANFKIIKKYNPWIREDHVPNSSRRNYIIKLPDSSSLNIFDNIKKVN